MTTDHKTDGSDNTTKQVIGDLPLLPLLSICTIGSAVEYCWAAGEAVLVPHLLRHGVRPWVVSTIYLSNPTAGMWVQPLLGKYSDGWNARIPFVVGLAVLAIVGVVLLLSAMSVSRAFGSRENDAFSPGVVAAVFVGFGIADICYDCLLIPGRALLDDMAVPAGRAEEANALFTGFQLCGRLLALLVVSSSIAVGFGGLFDGDDAHFNAVISSVIFYLICTVSLVVLLVNDTGSRPVTDEVLNDETDEFIESCQKQTEGLGTNSNCNGEHEADNQPLHPVSNKTNYHPLFISTTQLKQSGASESILICSYISDATVLLCAVQAVGWTAITAQSFFWTSWRGEQTGSIDLALQGLVGIVTSALLPMANKHVGASTVWCGSELFFHLLMMSVAFVDVEGNAPRIISALCGINYAVHATNGLIVAANVVADHSKRARTIAMVNNALPMGQLVTALFGGTIAQYFSGFRNDFVCFGFVGCVVTTLVWIVSSRQGLFAGKG